jgi:hypothetical protein
MMNAPERKRAFRSMLERINKINPFFKIVRLGDSKVERTYLEEY